MRQDTCWCKCTTSFYSSCLHAIQASNHPVSPWDADFQKGDEDDDEEGGEEVVYTDASGSEESDDSLEPNGNHAGWDEGQDSGGSQEADEASGGDASSGDESDVAVALQDGLVLEKPSRR
jgi:hypothetical protein